MNPQPEEDEIDENNKYLQMLRKNYMSKFSKPKTDRNKSDQYKLKLDQPVVP